jgi:ribosomal protein S18 acetylase RimI-like enzyme
MKMNIRPYTIDDIIMIDLLFDDFLKCNPSLPYKQNARQIYLNWLLSAYSAPDTCVYVVEQNQSIIGSAVGMIKLNKPLLMPEKIGYIGMFIVQSGFRRMGIGKSLYKKLFEWFMSRDVHEIQLTIEINNEIAAKFWESIGFKTDYVQKSMTIRTSAAS